ncbi:MAG: tRNA (guanosine(46)-N7)-methyltransferase TrmB [Verrucomicrobia bacterium]|nr:tRNA (guanosine(46)-N7)-methyltransferase TrmB [Verrucomicrobiota bacterium]
MQTAAPAEPPLTRAAAPTLTFRLASIVERIDLGRLFPRSQPVELELGSGDGSFLVQYARLHPERNFLGIERLLGRLRKVDRKAQRAGLTNVRLLSIEAAYFLEYLLPPKSIAALHVYFPDPWPKRRHRPKRLVNARFTELAKRALLPRGLVHLRTDDADYFAQMSAAFRGDSAFETVEPPAELCALATDFERDFHARGIATLHASFRLRDGG